MTTPPFSTSRRSGPSSVTAQLRRPDVGFTQGLLPQVQWRGWTVGDFGLKLLDNHIRKFL